MRTIELNKNKITLTDEIEKIAEGKVKKIGTGAMLLVPKKYIDKEAYILIKKS
jgi:putative transposon-encoded protein